jgi:hypothetical protein
VSQGAILLPPFDAHVFSYRTSVAEYVSAIRITAYLPADSKDYEIKVNTVSIRSGEESPPLQIGGNEETVEFAIHVSAAEHRPVVYSLSVYRGEMFHPFTTTLCSIVKNFMDPYLWGL